jgi:hypothetical protein
VYGEDSDVSPLVLGIDGVIAAIQAALDLAEATLLGLQEDLTLLESEATPVFYAKIVPSGGAQTVANGLTWSLVDWDTALFDQGNVFPDSGSALIVPVGGAGAWQIRAHITVPPWQSNGDDFRAWELRILRNGLAIATARTPHQNDGGSANAGDITLTAEALEHVTDAELAGAGASFTAEVRHWQPDSEGPQSASISATSSKTYFSAARVAPLQEVAP